MNKKLLLGIIVGSLALTSLAHAGWKEWAAGISFGSIIPILAYAYHTKNVPLAFGYTVGASLASLGLLLWADSQPTVDIELIDATDNDAIELNALSAIEAISTGKKAKIIYHAQESTKKFEFRPVSKTVTIQPIPNLSKALDTEIKLVRISYTFSHPIDTKYNLYTISSEISLLGCTSYEARVNAIRDNIVYMVKNHLIGNHNIQQL